MRLLKNYEIIKKNQEDTLELKKTLSKKDNKIMTLKNKS